MNGTTTITIVIEDELAQNILKDTLADSRKQEQDTLYTIFEVGLSLVAGKIAERCPRLHNNLLKWVDEDGDNNEK